MGEKKKDNEDQAQVQDLDTFVGDMNAQATHLADPKFFLVRGSEEMLLSIEVRFSPASYRWYQFSETWKFLEYNIKTRSHKTLFVATEPEMLRDGGILELKVAGRRHNYNESFVAKTLEWLSEYFFPKAAKHRNIIGD